MNGQYDSELVARLVGALATGEPLDLSGMEVEASLISAALNGSLSKIPDAPNARGLQLSGARIVGAVDWEADHWTSFALVDCLFDEPIQAAGLTVGGSAEISGCSAPAVDFSNARIEGSFDLSGLTAGSKRAGGSSEDEAIRLCSVHVRGDLILDALTVRGVLDAANATIGGKLSAVSASVAGEMRLAASTISGELDLSGIRIDAPDGLAVSASRARVQHSISLSRARIVGEVAMINTRTGGDLILSGANLLCEDENRWALNLYGMEISQQLFGRLVEPSDLDEGLSIDGGFCLAEARLGGCYLEGAEIANSRGQSIDASLLQVKSRLRLVRSKVRGDIWMNGAHIATNLALDRTSVDGTLAMIGIEIGGQLSMNGTQITAKTSGGVALNLFQATISQGIFARVESESGKDYPFRIMGCVRLTEATTSRLDMPMAHLSSPNETCLEAMRSKVSESVDLSSAHLEGALNFGECELGGSFRLNLVDLLGSLSLNGATVGGQLSMNGTKITAESDNGVSLNLFQAQITKGVFARQGGPIDQIRNFSITGQLHLAGANLRRLDMPNASFTNSKGMAINAEGLLVSSSVDLRHCKVDGDVSLRYGEISTDVIMAGSDVTGHVSLASARIGGLLNLNGAALESSRSYALDLTQAEVRGGLSATPFPSDVPFKVKGGVLLLAARLGGLLLPKSQIRASDREAIAAVSVRVANRTVLEGSSIKGMVGFSAASLGDLRLAGATINGEVNLVDAEVDGAHFEDCILRNPNGPALRAVRMKSTARVVMDGANVIGRVTFRHATIEGDLSLQKIKLLLRDEDQLATDVEEDRLDLVGIMSQEVVEPVFVCDLAAVRGDVSLSGSSVTGSTIWIGAAINGSLDMTGASFIGSAPECEFQARQLHIDGRWVLRQTRWNGIRILLRLAFVSELVDSPNSWPTHSGAIDITGFTYGQFVDSYENADSSSSISPTRVQRETWSVRKRLGWIALQTNQRASDVGTPGEYSPQPYKQLAEVYGQVGKDHERRKVLMRQQRDLRKFGELGRAASVWNWLIGVFTGYGYSLWRALLAVAAVYLLAVGLVFGVKSHDGFVAVGGTAPAIAAARGPLTSSECTPSYPCVSIWVYPIDAAIPLITFHQSDYWAFNQGNRWGEVGELLFVLLTFSGWGFSTLLVAAGTGLIRKD